MELVGNSESPQDRQEMLALVWAVRDDALTDEQAARLDQLVCEQPAAREIYFDAMSLLASLRWHLPAKEIEPNLSNLLFGSQQESHRAIVIPSTTPAARISRGRFRVTPRLIGLAASVLLVGYFVTLAGLVIWDHRARVDRRSNDQDVAVESFATLTRNDDCQWTPSSNTAAEDRRAERTLRVHSGLAELKFAQGAKVVVSGPAEFEVRSKNSGFLRRGKLVAIVPPQAVGFTVITPKAEIVDLGTEFGLEVDDEQNAEVHVFEGVVVARPTESASAGDAVRITAGKALRVEGKQAKFTPIPLRSQWRSEFVGNSKQHPVILSAEPNSGRKYQVVRGGLIDGKPTYIEEPPYEWVGVDRTGLPRELLGADYVRTSNSDDSKPDFQLKLTLATRATLYVFMDTRGDSSPDWLTKDFVDTGLQIGLGGARGAREGESFVRFAVWKRHLPAGTVTLGRNCPGRVGHYAVAAVADFDSK